MLDILYTLGGMLLALAFVALVAGILRLMTRSSAKEVAEQMRRLESEPPAPDAIGARVVGKKTEDCYSGSAKSGTLAYNTSYLVCFRTETGEERVYAIPPEQYEMLREGDVGPLVTLEGGILLLRRRGRCRCHANR